MHYFFFSTLCIFFFNRVYIFYYIITLYILL